MRTAFTFMTTGEVFETGLPETAALIESTAVYAAGPLVRLLIYEPADRRTDPDNDRSFRRVMTARTAGADVSFYRLRQRAPLFAAFWRANDGFVYTFIDSMVEAAPGCPPPDMLDVLTSAARHIAVTETPHGPFAALSGPLGVGDPRDPLARDRVSFDLGLGSGEPAVLSFRREPLWAQEGRSRSASRDASTVRITTPTHVTVQATGAVTAVEELEAHASAAAASLVAA